MQLVQILLLLSGRFATPNSVAVAADQIQIKYQRTIRVNGMYLYRLVLPERSFLELTVGNDGRVDVVGQQFVVIIRIDESSPTDQFKFAKKFGDR